MNFKLTKEEAEIVSRIAARAKKVWPERTTQDFFMDLSVVHNNIGLRLEDLSDADDFNFIHDVGGIGTYLDRQTGKLTNHFVPRFARRQ